MWKYLALEASGLHHRSSQDACQIVVQGECLIMAVADGAGSAAYGHTGAKLAANILLREAKRLVLARCRVRVEAKEHMQAMFRAVRKAIDYVAKQNECQPSSYATTAMIAIATPAVLVTGHIGDGGIVGLMRNGHYLTASPPQRGRFSHHTYFITDDDYEHHLRLGVTRRRFDAVVAFTDGVQSQVFCESGVNHNFIAPFVRDLRDMKRSEAQSQLNDYLTDLQSVTDDDVTIALACRGKST